MSKQSPNLPDISMIQDENNDVDEEIKAMKEEMENLKRGVEETAFVRGRSVEKRLGDSTSKS